MHLKWEKMCVDQSDNWWEVQLKVAHNMKENPYQHNANQTVLVFFKKCIAWNEIFCLSQKENQIVHVWRSHANDFIVDKHFVHGSDALLLFVFLQAPGILPLVPIWIHIVSFAANEATSDSNFPSHINEFHNRWISFDTVRRMNSIFHHTHSPYMHSNRLPHQQSARYEVHGLVKLGCECHKCLLSSSLRKA